MAIIGNELLKRLRPKAKPYEVRDERLKGFVLRVQPSGAVSYLIQWERGRRKTIGRADKGMKAKKAREIAEGMLGQALLGQEPTLPHKGVLTLRQFLEEYGPWMKAHYPRSGGYQVKRLENIFADLLDLPLSGITPWHVEKFRTQKLKAGRTARTVNRDVSTLRACLRRAADWGKVESHPLRNVKPIKEDRNDSVRYLNRKEEKKLLETLDAREEKLRGARDRGNQWRRIRNYRLLPDLRAVTFADHIKPMVLLSLHTGIRQGELFRLRWQDLDLAEGILTIHGPEAKTSQTRHIPLNSIALQVLNDCKAQSAGSSGLVFPSQDRKPFDNVRKAWATVLKKAAIKDFRWHDLRHHFASRLVQAGVDLNTVRELLGHSELRMTLRYAHLAPKIKKAAVEKLVQPVAEDSAHEETA